MSGYADYSLSIRDSREWERKLPMFSTASTSSILPIGIINGFGHIPPVDPLLGGLEDFTADPMPITVYRIAFRSYWAGGTVSNGNTVDPEVVVNQGTIDLLAATRLERVTEVDMGMAWYRFYFDNIKVMWRVQGSGDPWTEIEAPSFRYPFALGIGVEDDFRGTFNLYYLPIFDAVLSDSTPVKAVGYTAAAEDHFLDVPASTPLDFMIVPMEGVKTDANNPFHISGITLGQFIKNAYDGFYSPRDENGDVIPTGIRYNEQDILSMTQPVLIRVTSPVKDARDWLESHAYAPSGYAPAFNHDMEISPKSQVIPTDADVLLGLTVIDDMITIPEPSWSHGENVYNFLEFTYSRYYKHQSSTATDGLVERSISINFLNQESIYRNGEKRLEIEGQLFSSTGNDSGNAIDVPEIGAVLAEDRRVNIFNRLRFGTPTFQLSVFRIATYHLRAGDFVRVNITWFPEYSTQIRGMDILAQIIAIADLDCNLRRMTFESCGPFPVFPSS